MQIIPALDIISGQCVRLRKGDYAQKTNYNVDPIEIAQDFAELGVTKLHLVDLDGAKAKELVNLKKDKNLESKSAHKHRDIVSQDEAQDLIQSTHRFNVRDDRLYQEDMIDQSSQTTLRTEIYTSEDEQEMLNFYENAPTTIKRKASK